MSKPGPKPRPKITIICAQCGSSFEVWPSWAKNGRAFCSNVCKMTARRGDGHPLYKGGRRVMPNGYVMVSVTGRGQIYEHRLVMERKLGRRLERREHVHHLNGDRADNRDENLALLDRDAHLDAHPHSRHKTGWSRLYAECIDCGRTDRRHKARGRCRQCLYSAQVMGVEGA